METAQALALLRLGSCLADLEGAGGRRYLNKSYRRLARQHHPDKAAPADKARATRAFQDLSEAKQVVEDALAKRQRQREADAFNKSRKPGGGSSRTFFASGGAPQPPRAAGPSSRPPPHRPSSASASSSSSSSASSSSASSSAYSSSYSYSYAGPPPAPPSQPQSRTRPPQNPQQPQQQQQQQQQPPPQPQPPPPPQQVPRGFRRRKTTVPISQRGRGNRLASAALREMMSGTNRGMPARSHFSGSAATSGGSYGFSSSSSSSSSSAAAEAERDRKRAELERKRRQREQEHMERTRREKERMERQKDALLAEFRRVGAYLSRKIRQQNRSNASSDDADDADEKADSMSDYGASNIRELHRRLKNLPARFQDHAVLAARKILTGMVKKADTWLTLVRADKSSVSDADQLEYYSDLLRLAAGTKVRAGIATTRMLRGHVKQLRDAAAARCGAGPQASGKKRKKVRRRSTPAAKKQRRKKPRTPEEMAQQQEEEEEEEESASESESESEDEEEEEEEILSAACLARGWRRAETGAPGTSGAAAASPGSATAPHRVVFVVPGCQAVVPGVTCFFSADEGDAWELRRTKLLSQLTTSRVRDLKDFVALKEAERRAKEPSAEDRQKAWMAAAEASAGALQEKQLVDVMRRKWPGINKDGGRAVVTSIHPPRVKKPNKKQERAQALAKALAEEQPNGWGCIQCTYENTGADAAPTVDACKMCGAVRPAPSVAAVERGLEAVRAEHEAAQREADASGVRLFDVKYILGGREKDLEGKYVRSVAGNEEPAASAGAKGAAGAASSPSCSSSTSSCSSSSSASASASSGDAAAAAAAAESSKASPEELQESADLMVEHLRKLAVAAQRPIETKLATAATAARAADAKAEAADALSIRPDNYPILAEAEAARAGLRKRRDQVLRRRLRHLSLCFMDFVADCEAVQEAFRKCCKDEIDLSEGESRKNVNMEARLLQMRTASEEQIDDAVFDYCDEEAEALEEDDYSEAEEVEEQQPPAGAQQYQSS